MQNLRDALRQTIVCFITREFLRDALRDAMLHTKADKIHILRDAVCARHVKQARTYH